MSDLVPDVLRHRLVLSYEALADNLTADQIVQRVMKAIGVPDKPMAHAPAQAHDDSHALNA
jgi:MoxR-like ATPase